VLDRRVVRTPGNRWQALEVERCQASGGGASTAETAAASSAWSYGFVNGVVQELVPVLRRLDGA
jgi:hypothetical protein